MALSVRLTLRIVETVSTFEVKKSRQIVRACVVSDVHRDMVAVRAHG
jgi:hypothetical protein